ncbi:MAG: helix-turn-helix domain-containing protein [Clostridia bacterium]|nr:helix-turn-helix domain-containing protein [Clostridia bacterium]
MFYQKENSGHRGYHDVRRYSDFAYRAHMHSDPELVWLLSGRLEILIDGQTEMMEAGDSALIWPNQMHAYRAPSANAVIVHVFSADAAETFFGGVGDRIGERAVFRCPQWVQDFCLQVYREEETPSPLLLQACLTAACDSYRHQVALIAGRRENDHLFVRILDYVDAHFREDITLVSTAAALGYEPHYLSRYFGRIARTNFRQLLNGRRVLAAQSLLADPTLSITEAAMQSGFQSIRNFNRVFIEQVGVSPREYRSMGSPQLPAGSRTMLS